MKNFWLFVKERLTLAPNVIMVLGMLLSARALQSYPSQFSFSWPMFIAAFVLVFVFLAELRFMDELKDYKKDLVAHPSRPLPRGLITPELLRRVLGVTMLGMLGAALVLSVVNFQAALLYAIVCVWLWLMYKEFFLGTWLSSRPLLYAISHQVIIFPVILFVYEMLGGGVQDPQAIYFALFAMTLFFMYEVCRKLDPKAHPLLETYRYRYGLKGVIGIVLSLAFIQSFASLYVPGLFWASLMGWIVVLMLLGLAFTSKVKPKDLEGLVGLFLLIGLYFPALRSLWI